MLHIVLEFLWKWGGPWRITASTSRSIRRKIDWVNPWFSFHPIALYYLSIFHDFLIKNFHSCTVYILLVGLLILPWIIKLLLFPGTILWMDYLRVYQCKPIKWWLDWGLFAFKFQVRLFFVPGFNPFVHWKKVEEKKWIFLLSISDNAFLWSISWNSSLRWKNSNALGFWILC